MYHVVPDGWTIEKKFGINKRQIAAGFLVHSSSLRGSLSRLDGILCMNQKQSGKELMDKREATSEIADVIGTLGLRQPFQASHFCAGSSQVKRLILSGEVSRDRTAQVAN